MDKKTYTINQTTPGLGKAGDSVDMTERQARYLLLSGVISVPAQKTPATKKPSKGKKG